MQISRKQKFALDLLDRDNVNELLIGGSAGGSKSLCMCLMMINLCRRYPGAVLFLGRKTLQSLKRTTLATLLTQVHPMANLAPDEFALRIQDSELIYSNGSKILFGELDKNPSDPDFARIGSLEIDCAFIDEAGEISIEAKNAIKSRVGRGVMAKLYGIPGKVISSCNPSFNFLRSEYYEPYIKLGGGDYQEWQINTITVRGKELPSYRAFLRMSAYDNPFLPKSYIDNLRSLPDRERKRLLDGNWNYADDENTLFSSALLDRATSFSNLESSEKFKKFIGVDVSDKGTDATVFTLIDNGIVVTQHRSRVQMNWDQKSELPISRLIADELIEFAQKNGFTPQFARHIAVECNGIGAACLPPGEFVSTTTGLKQIEKITSDDTLISVDGNETKIEQFLQYDYNGEVYAVSVYGDYRPTRFTGEHPILVSDIKIGLNEERHREIQNISERWVKAENLKNEMYLREKIPYTSEKPIPDFSKYNYCKSPNRYPTKSEQIELNDILAKDDFWWLVGYWLGDGWAQHPKSGKNEVHFCFNREQLYFQDKIDKLASLLHRKPTHYTKPSIENTVIRCTNFANFIVDEFGEKAHGKKIPEWVKYLNKNRKLQLLQGFFDSDGSNGVYMSKGKPTYKISFSSCNDGLLRGLQDLLLSLGYLSSLAKHTKHDGFKPGETAYTLVLGEDVSLSLRNDFPDKNDVKLADIQEAHTPRLENRTYHSFIRDGYVYRRIKQIDIEEFTGKVYNFATDSDTYMCGHIPTHNCRDALKERGWYFSEYIATHKSRSQNYYQMMLDFDTGELKLMHDLLGLDELRKQLTAHTYEMNNQEPSVVKKEKLKQVLGHSPDEADSLMIANYCRNLISNPQNDPKRNANRILF